jgi:hypothetical protein
MAVVMPTQAQSHKDKRAAKKAKWEMEQKQQREEAELRHQMRMDSLRNAQKVAAENEAKAEAERRTAEAEAKAKQKKAEEMAVLQEQDFNEHCADYVSTADVVYGRGSGEDFEQQLSADIARTTAIEQLASQLATKVQAMVTNYRKQARKNTKRETLGRIEALTITEVDQAVGFRIACRKTKTYIQDGERLFKTYMVVELNEGILLSAIYKKLQQDPEMNVDANYNQFKQEFDEHFKSKYEEVIEQAGEAAQE